MSPFEGIAKLLRGSATSRLLRTFGVDPKRYWLLMDLFDQLSDRREMLNQLGRDGMTLKVASWIYFGMAGLITVMFILAKPPVTIYFWSFLGITAFLLLSILLSETSNSLVNPVEGLILAHHPIDGATYTCAKLSHLARIVLYLVPGLNAIPAVAGMTLEGAGWLYPLTHMLAALGVGLLAALLACAAFGWLIRFVPSSRLKAVGQAAELMPFLAIVLFSHARKAVARFDLLAWLPQQPEHRAYLAFACSLAIVAIVVSGIRSLSGDYLIRVSSIVQGRSTKSKAGRSPIGRAIARLSGGQVSRAGFEYVSRLMVRDWQFRRQFISFLPALVGFAVFAIPGLRTSPFSGQFTPVHVMPHFFGMLLFWICSVLVYGSHHKAAWLFLLVPNSIFGRFAQGVFALLWVNVIVIPHFALLLLLAWRWGVFDASLFVAYSLAVASTYLGLELRLIDGLPFGKQPETSRSPFMIPLIILGGVVMSGIVALQHFLIFRSPLVVAAVTLMVGAAAYLTTRSSLSVFEVAIRYNLGLLTSESDAFYKEVEV